LNVWRFCNCRSSTLEIQGGNVIHLTRGLRVILAATLALAGAGVSGCTMHQKQATKLASPGKPAAKPKAAKAAAPAKPPADALSTASLGASPKASGPEADLAGKTWIYRYGKTRGTIVYHSDGVFTYDEPGVRSGSGKWQVNGDRLCHSFSGIPEPCQALRKAGGTYYAGSMTLVMAKP
jgi:hypothetical protein